MVKKWKILSTKEIADYYIFKVFQNNSESPLTGKAHNFYALHAKDWANVIAITPDKKVVMVRQYRHGIDDITLEFPAGGMDENDPHLEATIRRELLEETGYSAEKVVDLGFVHANPAFLNNKCHTFLALDATKKDAQNLDDTEDISIEEIPLVDIPKMISAGQITHSLSVVAYFLYTQYESR
ncbi:MAG TPA: NUDIX hydrolase [Patescibacteria group bacterium]|jgi:8-oxo-dGTP pyrophosphatase MutT (NUDIX family)|nr:NUDIX hydrolase [Patescibacteria group bacterium]